MGNEPGLCRVQSIATRCRRGGQGKSDRSGLGFRDAGLQSVEDALLHLLARLVFCRTNPF